MTTINSNPLLDELKKARRAEAEKLKNEFWSQLVANSGGIVPSGVRRVFDDYCTSVERILQAMFADMDAMQRDADGIAALQDAIRKAVTAGETEEAKRLYYQWSEANFARTGVVLGAQFN